MRLPLIALLSMLSLFGCSGVVKGTRDNHCAGVPAPDASGFSCAAADPNAAPATYGETMYGDAGDDDDCKYHVVWSANNVVRDADVNFTVVPTWRNNGAPLIGAKTRIEAFIPPYHPAPNSDQETTENPLGTYHVGPVHFDQSGRWTVRFHFYEECADADNSLHGHAAFFVAVP